MASQYATALEAKLVFNHQQFLNAVIIYVVKMNSGRQVNILLFIPLLFIRKNDKICPPAVLLGGEPDLFSRMD